MRRSMTRSEMEERHSSRCFRVFSYKCFVDYNCHCLEVVARATKSCKAFRKTCCRILQVFQENKGKRAKDPQFSLVALLYYNLTRSNEICTNRKWISAKQRSVQPERYWPTNSKMDSGKTRGQHC